MESDSAEFIERTNFEEENSQLSRTFFMLVYPVVFHFEGYVPNTRVSFRIIRGSFMVPKFKQNVGQSPSGFLRNKNP